MGWLREKYTRDYFIPAEGQTWGVDGFDAFKRGSVYEPVKSILEAISWEGCRVLEIGPGRGEALRLALENGAVSAKAYEFAEPAVEITRDTLQAWSDVAEVVHEDALVGMKTEDGEFDVCLMFDVIEHIPEREFVRIMTEVTRVLRRGGLFVWHTPNYIDKTRKTASDLIPQTAGMHCNKKDWHNLSHQLESYGLLPTALDPKDPKFFIWRKRAPMPSSIPDFIPTIVRQLQADQPMSVLDVGVGFGKMGYLVREYLEAWNDRVHPNSWRVRLDGVEAWEPYTRLEHVRALYNKIHQWNVETWLDNLEPGTAPYDVVIAGDVIEHMPKASAAKVLQQLLKITTTSLIVSIPVGPGWLNNTVVDKNPFEKHRSEWTVEELRELGEVVYEAKTGGAKKVALLVYRGEYTHVLGRAQIAAPAPKPAAQPVMMHVHNVQRCGGTGNFVHDMALAFPQYSHVALCVNDPCGDPRWREDVSAHLRTLYAEKLTPEILDDVNPSVLVLHSTTGSKLKDGPRAGWPFPWLSDNGRRFVVAVHHTATWPTLRVDLDVFVSEFIEKQYEKFKGQMQQHVRLAPVGDLSAFHAIERDFRDIKKNWTAVTLGKGKLACPVLENLGYEIVKGNKPRLGKSPAILQKGNIAVVWSGHHETWCRTVTEAMASGAIVIAHNSGAIPEQIEDGVTGFLFDTEEGLTAIVESVRKMPMERKLSISAAARQWTKDNVGQEKLRKTLNPLLLGAALGAV